MISFEYIDAQLKTLQENKEKWIETSIDERISILNEIKHDLLSVTEQWIEYCTKAKGIPRGTFSEVFEWNMLQTIFTLLASLKQSLTDIKKCGRPQISGGLYLRPNGQVAAKVFPRSRLEAILYPNISMEVWMQPGVSVKETIETQAKKYREEQPGKISLVLGAGNASALQVADLLYKLYVEKQVVILKMNPVNSYLKPLLEKAFNSLINRDVLRIVSGGVEIGSHLCNHPHVDNIHMTGSDKTFEAIVFGTGEDGERRKNNRNPLMDKPITGELGNITPIIIIPGHWSEEDIKKQATKIVSWHALNAGSNCFTPRLIIQEKDWEHRKELTKAMGEILSTLDTQKAYYPGIMERYSKFFDAHPEAKTYGNIENEHLPWTMIEDIDPYNVDDIFFTTEAFGSLIAETGLDASNIHEYIEKAVKFVNETLWGTLTTTILVHPDSLKDSYISDSLDSAISNLRYGTVSVNELGVLSYLPGVTTWGGFPGSSIYDVQSGIGVINNYLMFDKPEKSVTFGPFTKIDPQLITFKHGVEFASKYTYYQAKPSILRFFGLFWTILQG
jgi:acyl-CoA reductase-like NAD-dependent aldehyde dehydrogenase